MFIGLTDLLPQATLSYIGYRSVHKDNMASIHNTLRGVGRSMDASLQQQWSLHRDTWSMECGQWWGYREPGESHVCDNEARNAEAYTFII